MIDTDARCTKQKIYVTILEDTYIFSLFTLQTKGKMIRIVEDILTEEDIQTIHSLEAVIEHRKIIGYNPKSYKRIYFHVVLPETIVNKINAAFGLHLDPEKEIPIRWLQGDNPQHVDKDKNNQTWTTYLLYLTDNEGKLIVEKKEYEIKKGRGYVFGAGVIHETKNTYSSPKLAIVINERGEELYSTF